MKKMKKALTEEQALIRELSDRLVEAQRPIRILDAIKWDDHIKDEFFKSHFKKLPKVNKEYYAKNPLSFDPKKKTAEFFAIEHDIRKRIGSFSGVSQMMQRMSQEYRLAVDMLANRGGNIFGKISQQLYGSSDDAFYTNAPSLNDLAKNVSHTLDNISKKTDNVIDKKQYTAEEAAAILSKKLSSYFREHTTDPKVIVSDNIVSDAAAGAERIKMKKNIMFSKRNIKQLEVHEGWVHLGTTINGKNQPICTFLSKGVPSSTVTQEGLAILMEILSYASYPQRVRRITDRIVAINMAENGADFIEVFNYYLSQSYDEEQSYAYTVRVFRGSTPKGKPFTKDLSYNKGFIEIFNYIRLAINHGLVKHLPYLFVGKTSLEDMRIIVDLVEEGLVVKPKFLPPQFKDLAPLTAWAAYSLFVNDLDVEQIAFDIKGLLRK
jgi:uncharacterized protein (TIGR02421 family)